MEAVNQDTNVLAVFVLTAGIRVLSVSGDILLWVH